MKTKKKIKTLARDWTSVEKRMTLTKSEVTKELQELLTSYRKEIAEELILEFATKLGQPRGGSGFSEGYDAAIEVVLGENDNYSDVAARLDERLSGLRDAYFDNLTLHERITVVTGDGTVTNAPTTPPTQVWRIISRRRGR